MYVIYLNVGVNFSDYVFSSLFIFQKKKINLFDYKYSISFDLWKPKDPG